MTTEAFWARVKKLIKAHKMTQKQFAQHINISSGTFEGMIYHNRMPILSLALDIASALGNRRYIVTVEYLANGKDQETAKRRHKELSDRQSAIQISKLAAQIQKETEKIQGKPKAAL